MAEHCGHTHRGEMVAENRRRLLLVLIFTSLYLCAEVIGGLLTNSLALFSDAGHMLTDIGALLLALLAIWFGLRPPTPRKTFGYYRMEILAALVNGLVLLGLSALIIIESVMRLRHPPPVDGLGLLIVASGGLVVNLASAYVLHHGHAHSLNVRAAFYHVLGDALGSLGAMTAGVLIIFLHWYASDPIIAIVIAVLIIIGAYTLVRESVDVLLEATPAHVDIHALRAALLAVPGVTGVHDLHIWTITSEMYALSVHVVVHAEDFTVAKLEDIRLLLHEHCEILHQTIQLETDELAAEEEIHL